MGNHDNPVFFFRGRGGGAFHAMEADGKSSSPIIILVLLMDFKFYQS